MNARCPDCGVELSAVDLETGDGRLSVATEHGDDVLSAVGVVQLLEVEARRCEECGLVRFYADGE